MFQTIAIVAGLLVGLLAVLVAALLIFAAMKPDAAAASAAASISGREASGRPMAIFAATVSSNSSASWPT